nr:unnamed protein product [Callosobruchus chinensis]
MLGYYRIQIRSKKWYMRVFFHFLDMICVNCWILWRPNPKNDNLYLPLSEFKLALAVLTRANALQRKRGRPSTSLQPQLELKKKKYPFSQGDKNRELEPLTCSKWGKTKMQISRMQMKAHISCVKCLVFLRLNQGRNCFYKFHTEQSLLFTHL